MTEPAAGLAASFTETTDGEPWAYYEHLRERGVAWDPILEAWAVASYGDCKHVLRSDKRLFHHPGQDTSREDPIYSSEGPMNTIFLEGERHARVHTWWVRQFKAVNIESWRTTFIRPLVEALIDGFASRGGAELSSELVEPLPIRVIAAVVGLPWEDDAFIDRLKVLFKIKLESFDGARATHGGPTAESEEVRRGQIDALLAASREFDQLVMPTIEARRRAPTDDVISRLWEDGPELLQPFDVREMCSAVYNIFFAGTDTTAHATRNALHALATHPELAEQVRAGGDPVVLAFVEEALRLTGTVHFRPRVADAEVALGEVTIRRGDRVLAMLMAANRDPAHYDNPDVIDLARSAPTDHLAFNFGPRFCAGAGLARAVIQEAVRGAVQRLPELRLDPEAPPSRFTGFVLRSYQPLHVRFATAGSPDARSAPRGSARRSRA
jgi:cytochrome P450